MHGPVSHATKPEIFAENALCVAGRMVDRIVMADMQLSAKFCEIRYMSMCVRECVRDCYIGLLWG